MQKFKKYEDNIDENKFIHAKKKSTLFRDCGTQKDLYLVHITEKVSFSIASKES